MKVITIKGIREKYAGLADTRSIFDKVRRKHVVATPEEKIRQLMIQFLIEKKNYPRSLFGVEVSLSVNRMMKRCDILVYKNGYPAMIVECKAPSVKIDQSVFEQASRYNMALNVPYLLVTNGLITLCSKLDLAKSVFEFLEEIPDYKEL